MRHSDEIKSSALPEKSWYFGTYVMKFGFHHLVISTASS